MLVSCGTILAVDCQIPIHSLKSTGLCSVVLFFSSELVLRLCNELPEKGVVLNQRFEFDSRFVMEQRVGV